MVHFVCPCMCIYMCVYMNTCVCLCIREGREDGFNAKVSQSSSRNICRGHCWKAPLGTQIDRSDDCSFSFFHCISLSSASLTIRAEDGGEVQYSGERDSPPPPVVVSPPPTYLSRWPAFSRASSGASSGTTMLTLPQVVDASSIVNCKDQSSNSDGRWTEILVM